VLFETLLLEALLPDDVLGLLLVCVLGLYYLNGGILLNGVSSNVVYPLLKWYQERALSLFNKFSTAVLSITRGPPPNA